MDCDLCGTVNRANARFCGGCGSALALRCPNCKAELDAGLSFCDQCGTTLEAAPRGAAPPTAGAVRKTVTVLFADLGGSTGFGERTDPEISRQVLARYHALLQETIDAHRGTVAKFMGDGMMATFGIPEVAEDDARRAVLAGVDIQRRFEAFAADVLARYGETLTMRVGINTGEVVIASGDADLVGDALNVAARLEKACRPGHVLVGDETWRITRGELAYEPLGEVTVAGRAGPVGTYEVIGTGAATTDPVVPFVGRVGETTRLRAAFDRARTDKSAVLVTVLGSPGMGKTRLSRELASTLAVDEDATTFEIRCDRSGGATFAPFADLVREAAGIAEIEDGEDAAEVTRDRIGALVRDDADRGRVVDVIAGVLGAAPARSVEETFWGIRRVIESLATDRPLVVVIDDIQWAEPKLLDLLEHLAEWVQSAAVLLVCLARPELRELRPSLTEPGRRVADVLALDGLDASATAELASGLLGSALPTELIDRLPVSTDGNPLFVRELVRMLVDDAVIRRRDDGAWELAIDAEAIEVPPTIQSLLATRVERLPAEELRVLELASVIGAEFSIGALRELAGSDIAVTPVLERLRRKELVEPTGSYWGDDPLHRFHHVLIRDAAYRRLLKTTRAELHRQVGEWTDASAGDLIGEHETAIAFHFEQAHRYRMELGSVDEETDRLGRRAAELLGVAARRALDREDLTSAGALARRALAALPESDIDDRADLLLIACECFLSSGDVTAGAPLVAALDALSGDNEQLGAWAACYRAQLIGLTDPDGVVAAEEMASTAATALASLGDGAGEAKAHQVRALLLARLGRVGEAEVVLDLALGAARASDDRRRVTAVLGAAPQAALFGPSPVARAGGRCLDVVRLLRITTASPSVEATSMRCQAVLEALRGRFDVSRSMLASARASLEELGLRHGLLETDLFTGMVELIAGNPGAAIDPLRAAYEGLGTLGVGADAGQAAALLATALLARGETDEAELMAGESEALAGQNLKTAIAWRIARAEVHAARGDAAAGVTIAGEAVEIAAGTDLILDHADACVVLADLCRLAGDAPAAERARAEARRLYEAKGATVPAGRLALPSSIAGTSTEAPDQQRAPSMAAPTGDPRSAACENRATDVVVRLASFINSGQDPPEELVSQSFELQDRRSLVGLGTADAVAIGDNFAIMRDQGYTTSPPLPLAVRGERLAAHRTRAQTPAGDETVLVSVDEIDADGRLCRIVWFDEDDLAAALAELDERFYFGEGASFQRVLGAVGRYAAAYEHHDLDGVRDHLAPDFVMVDHQPLGFGAGDRDYFLEMSRDEWRGDGRGVNRVLYVNEHALLGVNSQALLSEEGSRYERSNCTVLGIDATDRVNRIEMFSDDDFAAALARFDELGAGVPADRRTATAENAATRLLPPWFALFNAGKFDEMRVAAGGLFAPECVRIDRRPTVSAPDADAPGVIDSLEALYDLGLRELTFEAIAVRGERLMLFRQVFRTVDGTELVLLNLTETDAAGRASTIFNFEEEQLAEALTELDTRFFLGEGAPYQRVLRAVGRYAAASANRDVDAILDHLAPDFVVVDHQPLGFGAGDRDYFVDMTRLAETDDELVNCVIHVNEHALLAVYLSRPLTDEGSRYERSGVTVMGLDASDRVNRIEMFSDDDFAAALARLDELCAAPTNDPRTAKAENTTTRLIARTLDLMNRGEWEALAAMNVAADGVVRFDRRRTVSAPTLNDRESFGANAAGIYEVLGVVRPEPVAVRGERLALIRLHCGEAPAFTMQMLVVYELDDEGRIVREVDFDDDDLVDALGELDARYAVGEGAEFAAAVRPGVDHLAAFHARDWAALAASVRGYEIVDHRGLWPDAGPDAYVERMQSLAATAPDATIVARKLHVHGDAVLMTADVRATAEHGDRHDYTFHTVGRPGRFEYFDEHDFAAALARLDELGAEVPTDPRTAKAENVTTGLLEQVVDHLVNRRFDRMRELLVDDFVRDDRRHGVSAPYANGPDEWIAHSAANFDVGFDAMDRRPIAVRGEHLALFRIAWTSTDGRFVPFLSVFESDGIGRLVRSTHFDEDDLVAALAELDERFLGSAAHDPFNTRDWAAMRERFHPDLIAVDRRQLMWPALDRDAFVEMQRGHVELVPDMVFSTRVVHFQSPAMLMVLDSTGTTGDGAAVEWNMVSVVLLGDDGLFLRLELFDEADFAAALARLDELGAQVPVGDPPTAIDNAATAAQARVIDVCHRRRFDELRTLLTDDFVREDRRHGVAAPTADGPDEFVRAYAAWFDVGFETLQARPVAVRGDRLVLARFEWRSADDRYVGFLGLYELAADGRFVRGVHFDDDDLDAALDELDERHIAGEGADHEYLIRRIGDFRHARAARDWDGVEALFSPEYVGVDRRRLGLGTGTRSGYLAASRAMVELVPDATFVPRVIETRGDLVLLRTAGSGTSVDGSRSEWEQRVVWQFAAGCVVRGEVFALEDEAVARARFDELATQTLTPYVDNRLVRIGVRAQWLGRFTDARRAFYGDDCVLEDRRPGVNAGTVQGAAAVDASVQSGVDVFGVLEIDWLAVRGDRLALNRWAFVADSGFEAPGLSVIELDEDDLVCRVTSFEESDLAGAIAFLEERHVELRGDAITSQELTTAIGSRAFNARDWDELGQVYAADVRFVLHTPFRTEGGWDDYLAQLQVLVEQVPDVALVFAKVTTHGRCGLSLLPFTGTTPEGNRYSWSMVQVTRMGDDGRIEAFELFDIEQWDDAAARFEEWAGESEVPTGAERTTSIENTASRLTAEAARGFGVEGGSGSEHQADDLVRVDHRRMIGVPTTTTREEFADAARAFADLGMTDMTFDVLAVRGDRCCLGRLTYSGADFDVSFLTVVGCNDGNKTAWIDNFDDDDLDAALDTLDERFIAGEGAEHHNVIRWWREFGAAYRDRDWAAVEEMYVSDAVLVDHRSIGQGWTNRADFLTSTRAAVELVPDVAHLQRRLEIRGPVTLTDGEAFGTTSDGSRYSWGYHIVTQWAGGRITRLEMFDAEESVAACGRFDELASETAKPDNANDNAAARLIVDASRLLWTDLDAALDRFSTDASGVARESGPSLGLSAENREMWRDVLGSLAETYDDVRYETLAIRGDRLALLRQEFVTDGYVTPALLMVETDEHNQIVRLETFAEEDLSRAIEELDRRSFELLGDAPGGPTFGPRAELGAMVQSISGAFAARDWEWIRSRVAPGAVLEDRRSTVSSHRAVDADAVVDLFRGWAEVGFETLENVAVAWRGEDLVLLRRWYRTGTGFELEMLVVIESQADGRMAAITLFDADALVPALADLELRYARSGAMSRPERSALVVCAALNHRRWSEFDAILASDVEVVDHRRLGFPPATGPVGLVHALQSLVAQVPDVVAIVTGLETSGDAVLAVVDQMGTSADGMAADWRWHNVIRIDRAGRISRMEYFDADDEDRARSRFEELARSGPEPVG